MTSFDNQAFSPTIVLDWKWLEHGLFHWFLTYSERISNPVDLSKPEKYEKYLKKK